MIVGGLQKFSLLDYPGHLAAIIFTQGCNFRCQFCYNPMLVGPARQDKVKNTASPEPGEEQNDHPEIKSEDDLFVFLENRRGKLDAVVITGGEPTLHPDLPEFIARIRAYGYKVKLDTNGTSPEMLERLFSVEAIDYLAMDIKAAPERYDQVIGAQPDIDRIRESIALISHSRRPYEFRTTIVPELVRPEDIAVIGEFIRDADLWYLQGFKSDTNLVNPSFEGLLPYTAADMEAMRKCGAQYVKRCLLR